MTFTCTGMIILVFGQLTCTAPEQPVTDTFCTRYIPIHWSGADTRGTKEQVDLMNRRWKRDCAGKRQP